MDVTEISPRKPFGFPGEDGSRRCSREEEEEEGRRRVGEEEEEEDEEEDRLDVVGLDECSSSRPGRETVSQNLVSSPFGLKCPSCWAPIRRKPSIRVSMCL